MNDNQDNAFPPIEREGINPSSKKPLHMTEQLQKKVERAIKLLQAAGKVAKANRIL